MCIEIEIWGNDLGRTGYVKLWGEGGMYFETAPERDRPQSWWRPDVQAAEMGSYEIWWRSRYIQLDLPGWWTRKRAKALVKGAA